ncbi:MaoC/PaaZ C-terminal domain-containing protein [Nocardioides cheoyonin]|uniref:MaoC/PaaZ C-terminal domain-containing protein n=1 Tax=Nocardioides cheoyonin TaxID=3156615 RepID=UPI0032B38D50
MALYFEDFEEGQTFVTPARTVTEADVVSFAAWTGDYNPVHTDAEFARGTRFGQRIGHGVLGVSLCLGLMSRIGVFEGSAVALLGIDDWRFRLPLLIDDTVHCRITIVGTRLTSSGTTGVLQRRFELVNQRGEVLQDGRMDVMVYCRGQGPQAQSDGHDGALTGTER